MEVKRLVVYLRVDLTLQRNEDGQRGARDDSWEVLAFSAKLPLLNPKLCSDQVL